MSAQCSGDSFLIIILKTERCLISISCRWSDPEYKVIRCNDSAFAQDYRTFNIMRQLPDITRPVIIFQFCNCSFPDLYHLLTIMFRKMLQIIFSKKTDIFSSFPEWRKHYLYRIDPVQQILPELECVSHPVQLHVGG